MRKCKVERHYMYIGVLEASTDRSRTRKHLIVDYVTTSYQGWRLQRRPAFRYKLWHHELHIKQDATHLLLLPLLSAL